jgi:hypothetical protein
MNKLQSTVSKLVTVGVLSGNITNAVAQQVNCISESSSWLFWSISKSACYVWNNRQEIKEWQTKIIDGMSYTMSGWQVKSKIDYSKPIIDPNDCTTETYANADWAWTRVVCGWKIVSSTQAK